MTDKPADYGTPAEALRLMKEPMPENFRWDFRTVLDRKGCGTVGCALGELGLKCEEEYPCVGWAVERFGFDPVIARMLFLDRDVYHSPYGFKPMYEITRDDVIRALERYVTTGKLNGE